MIFFISVNELEQLSSKSWDKGSEDYFLECNVYYQMYSDIDVLISYTIRLPYKEYILN